MVLSAGFYLNSKDKVLQNCKRKKVNDHMHHWKRTASFIKKKKQLCHKQLIQNRPSTNNYSEDSPLTGFSNSVKMPTYKNSSSSIFIIVVHIYICMMQCTKTDTFTTVYRNSKTVSVLKILGSKTGRTDKDNRGFPKAGMRGKQWFQRLQLALKN